MSTTVDDVVRTSLDQASAVAPRPEARPPLPPALAAYAFFHELGSFLRELAAEGAVAHDLALAHAALRRSLDALQRAVAVHPPATVHAYADCAALGEHVIALLAPLEDLLRTAGSSARGHDCVAAMRPAMLRLADAYERWADALADHGPSAASERVPQAGVRPGSSVPSSELEAVQHELVDASKAVMLQMRALVQASIGGGSTHTGARRRTPPRTAFAPARGASTGDDMPTDSRPFRHHLGLAAA